MESFVETLSQNPLVLVGVVLAVGMLVFAILKRLLKLAFVFLLGLVVVSGWFAYRGEQAPPALEKVQDGVKRTVRRGAEKGAQKARDIGEKVEREVEKKIGEEAKKAADAVSKGLEEAAEDAKEAAEEAIEQ